jgi:hypothetical protein
MRGGGTPEGDQMKLGTFVELLDVMNRANFHISLMDSLWAIARGKKEVLPVKCKRLLQPCLALPRWQVFTTD